MSSLAHREQKNSKGLYEQQGLTEVENLTASPSFMSEIVYVSPQLYLASDARWKSELDKPGYVPILRSDVYKFQESLKGILSAHGNLSPVKDPHSFGELGQSDANQVSISKDSGGKDSQSTRGTAKYQSLKHFLPVSLEQQLHTISLTGVPAKIAICDLDILLTRCVHLVLQHIDAAKRPDMLECWTNIQSLETQTVFIRFTQGHESFAIIVRLIREWIRSAQGPPIELHIDSNTERFINDRAGDNITLNQDLAESLNLLWQELTQSPAANAHVQDTNVEYRVDLNTLSDLPQESLGQLCQDIVEFRTRVVTIEREKRVREAYEESKRRRQQMMRMFDQIRKSRRDAGDHRGEQNEDEDGEDEDEEEEDDEDDSVLEQQRIDHEKQESDNRYQTLLKQVQTRIEPRLASLQDSINMASRYDQIRVTGRPLYLKELLHVAADPYYDHRRSYKEQEEQRDDIDRQEHPLAEEARALEMAELHGTSMQAHTEKQQQQQHPAVPHNDDQANEQFRIKFAFKKAIETSAETHTSSEDEDGLPEGPIPEGAPDVLKEQNLDAKLHNLKQSNLVQELVKEYLGVYEQELVDYIFDTIREKRSKIALLTELRETFDDDAVTIVEKIWGSGELNAT